MTGTEPAETQRRYLVAWGADKRSKDALALGVVLARTFGAKLDVVYVLHAESAFTVQYAGQKAFEDVVLQRSEKALAKALTTVPADLDVTTHVRRGPSIAEGILDTARELKASAVVIGAGADSSAPLMANPIVNALLHASPVPVAMAPRGYRNSNVERLGELVAALGFRPGAQRVVDEATAAAVAGRVPLRLISLVEIDNPTGDAERAAAEATEKKLDEAAAEVQGRCPVTTQVGQGRNLKQAMKALTWAPDSALVVGSSRLAQGRQTFVGTHASRMLAYLDVPIVVVPRKDG